MPAIVVGEASEIGSLESSRKNDLIDEALLVARDGLLVVVGVVPLESKLKCCIEMGEIFV